jgi:hypothetical protein
MTTTPVGRVAPVRRRGPLARVVAERLARNLSHHPLQTRICGRDSDEVGPYYDPAIHRIVGDVDNNVSLPVAISVFLGGPWSDVPRQNLTSLLGCLRTKEIQPTLSVVLRWRRDRGGRPDEVRCGIAIPLEPSLNHGVVARL